MNSAPGGRRADPILASRRVVIKVGSSVLTAPDEQGVNRRVLGRIATQVAELRRAGREVVLVSSGAIAAGAKRMGIQGAPKGIPERQAAAAVGQPILMEAYGRAFRRRGVETAQVLLTHDDLDHRPRFLNACNTFEALLTRGVLPIVNENDTVSVKEIRFGDNDTLAALVAQMVRAGLVVILSDVEGFYDADPRRDASAKLIPRVEGLPPAVMEKAGVSANPLAHGGMVTKVQAAKVLNRMGIATLIVRGRNPRILLRALERGGEGTLFVPNGAPLSARKGWIGTTVVPRGWIRLDAGAVTALVERGRSLLPKGIVEAEGDFRFGDVVELRDPDGKAVGRGLSNYGAEEVNRIAGKHTREIAGILGGKDYDEVVHRNNLVLLD